MICAVNETVTICALRDRTDGTGDGPGRRGAPGAGRDELKPGRERVGHHPGRRREPARSTTRLADRDVVADRERVGDEIPDVRRLRRDGLREREVGDRADPDRRAGRVVRRVRVERRGSTRSRCSSGRCSAAPAPTLTSRSMTTGVPAAGTVPTVHVIAVVPSAARGHRGDERHPGRQRVADGDPGRVARARVGDDQPIDERVADGQRIRHRRRCRRSGTPPW